MNGTLPLVLLSVLCGMAGQVSLKAGMTRVGSLGAEALAQPILTMLRVLTTPFVVGGLALYVLGAAFWLTVLSRLPLSLAYPILALSYAFTPVLAWLLLGESVSGTRWAGIATICLGVFIISRS